MFMEAAIDLWDILSDVGIASCLLLLAKVMRTRIMIMQRLFVPATLLAGLLGFVLGDSVLGWAPLSDLAGGYSGLLICAVFAAIGLTTRFPRLDELIHRTGRLWAFNQMVFLSQWIVGVLFAIVAAPTLFPGISPAFGLIFPGGWMGGHGTAAAMGAVLTDLGWEGALSLGLTSATIGVFAAVLGGMVIINVLTRTGVLQGVARFDDLDVSIRRGLIPPAQRVSVGDETVSASSLHVFTLHLALIGAVTFAGQQMAEQLSALFAYLQVPVFACCFLLGCAARFALVTLKVQGHFDDRITSAASSCATDFLIFFGISSIQLSVLLSNTLPFVLIIVIGVALCVFLTLFIAPRVLDRHWAEKAIFSWGWMTGTVALGILLLRICDPENRSHALEDYAIAYVPGSVVEILLISLVPGLVMMGYAIPVLSVLCLALTAVIAIFLFVIRRKAHAH